ncbi:unnamed protein product [Boreogadus saida]
MKKSKCVSMGPLAVSPSAVTRDRPAVASTHHGTTTLSGYPPRDHHRHRQQALHHRDTADRAVSSRELPRGMSRQVHKRSHFIKPITHRHHITKK